MSANLFIETDEPPHVTTMPPPEPRHDHMLDMPVEAVVWHYRRLEREWGDRSRTTNILIALLALLAVVGWCV